MGLIFSCCYRQRRPISEREPLLPKHHITDVVDPFTPSQDQLNKIAEVIAALKSGKLPSQEQVNHALRLVLQSDVLSEDHEFGYGILSEPGKEAVKSIREVIESFLQVGLEKNSDDTLQDFMFQCSLVPSVPVHADIAVEMNRVNEETLVQELPSPVEVSEDTSSLIRSLQTLLRILLTSSVFRLLLRDIFIVARDMAGDAVIAAKDGVADGARAMERTAQFVKSAAELVEDVAQNVADATRSRPSAVEYEGNPGETIRVETQIPTLESDIFSSEVPIHVNPERLKEVAVSRLQQAIIQAHADPSFRTALRTILILVRKYINKVRSTTDRLSDAQMPDFQPILWADPPLVNALSQLSTLLSRMASNRAMEPVLRAFHALVVDLADIPNALVSDIHSQNSQTFFAFLDSLGLWFDRALSDPQFVLSEEGKRNLDGLYDRAGNLVDEASHSDMDWIRHLRMLLHEINLFASALMEDKTTHRLLDALTTLSSSLSSFTQTAVIAAPGKLDAAKQKVRADLQRDLLRWLLPRLLRALHAIPMPRIEYRSTGSNLDAAIDTLYLTPSSAQASLVPDHVRICNWTELHLNVAEVNPQTDTIIPAYALPHGGMKTYSRVRVSVDGVRLSARNVGYYVCWKAFRSEWLNWLGYEDEGLVSVNIGGRGAKGQGLSFEFELAIAPDSDDQEADNVDSLFSVSNVHVSVPGLRFSLDRSKHRLLNKLLLQPLGGPIGQAAVGWVLRRQLQAALDGLGRIGADVRREALKPTNEARRDVEWSDYGSAIWKVFAELNHEENEEEEAIDETPLTETHTSATTKGIIRTTVTYPAAAENTSPRSSPLTPVDESTIALGVGAQILPGKGGPHDANPGEDGDQDRPQNIAREALDQVQARVEDVVETGEHIVQRTKDVGNEVEGARERERAAEGAESRKEGWRSHAFDAGR